MDAGRFSGRTGLGWAIILVAVVARGFDPERGLPDVASGEDWPHVFSLLDRAVGPLVLEPLARGAHFALLQLEYFTAYWTWQIGGAVPDYASFGVRMVEDPTRFWTVARAGVALLGAATVLLVFRHGQRLGGASVGVLAAVFLALCVRHVEASRRVSPECALVLFSFWALTLIVEARMENRPVPTWRFLVIGAAAGRGGWPGVLLLVPYLTAALGRSGMRALASMEAMRPALLAALLAGGAAMRSWSMGDLSGAAGTPAVSDPASWAAWLDALRAAWGSTGPAILLLATIGGVMSLRSGSAAAVLHVQYILALVIGLLTGLIDRSAAVVALPSVCLLAARALVDLVAAFRGATRASPALVAVLGVVVVLEPASATWDLLRHDAAEDTRVLAARWIEENVPDREVVVVPAKPQTPWQPQVPLRDLRRNMKARALRVTGEDPRVVPYWEAAIQGTPDRRYDLRLVNGDGPVGTSGADPLSPPAFAVVGASDTAWAGEIVARFQPMWPASKGPALEVRQLGSREEPDPESGGEGG